MFLLKTNRDLKYSLKNNICSQYNNQGLTLVGTEEAHRLIVQLALRMVGGCCGYVVSVYHLRCLLILAYISF